MSPAVDPAGHAKPRKLSGHPPFVEMISDAIHKFIEEKDNHLPTTFRKLLLVQLKRMVASGKLVRVKHTPSGWLRPPSPYQQSPSRRPRNLQWLLKPKAKGGVATKEKKTDAAGTKKRKTAEKSAGKLKPAVATAKAGRTSKKMISPGKKAGVSSLLQQQFEALARSTGEKNKPVVIGQDSVEPLQALRNAGQEVRMDVNDLAARRKSLVLLKRKMKEEKRRLRDQRRKQRRKPKEK